MSKHTVTAAEQQRAEEEALTILRSPRFFNLFLSAMARNGLVGEQRNALVLLIVATSRILPRPLNVFVKGHSSSGKNWLVTRVLTLLPKSAVAEITSASDQAWSYSGSDFRHRVVYLQEQNEAAGTIDPIRLLISEGKLARIVTEYEDGRRVTKKQTAQGPVAAISTTTKNRLQIDDETRHVSIWVDESSEQTRKIVKAYTQGGNPLSRQERRTWRAVQRLLEEKIGIKVVFPAWFEEVGELLFVDDLSVRRYYPAFIEACRTVSLIRSFQPSRKLCKLGQLEVDFADFAITALIFDSVFVESLHLTKGVADGTRRVVEEIAESRKRPVCARDIARKLKISMDQAYSKLRNAERAGAIRQSNKPERENRKWFLPAARPRFVPDPESLFRKLNDIDGPVRFVHPLTGDTIAYTSC